MEVTGVIVRGTMPPAKKMRIRTIVTSAVASVAVVGAVLFPVMLRGNNKTEGEPTNTSALIELDDGTVENSAYSRISAYSAFSDISLPSREKPYYEAFSKGSATEPEPTAGEETSRTEKTSKTSSGSSSAEGGSSNTQPQTTEKEPVISEISLLRLINSTHPLPSNFVPQTAKMDGQYEEAAFMLGASRRKTFLAVILPEVRPALLTGFGLAFARGIGEYGSVIYISGNSAKDKTQVISYVIMQKLGMIDYESATAIALLMLIISFVLLLFINIVQARQSARTNLL